ncbi:MAG: HlyD family type I secretion periplasmic adaptor subunit [Methylococcaceae bacterium]|nr:MAG: HlyD family type I secretion periplasmic adaptor subunit [Methylococcaceae bacterium]
MESTNKPPVIQSPHPAAKPSGEGAQGLRRFFGRPKPEKSTTVIEFLPDADEIERSPLPRSARITLHVMLTMLVFFLLWAIFSEVDKVVVATGRLITPLPNIIVQPLETSIIQRIDVRVGQVVKKGERLATLDPTFAEADESQLRIQLSSLDTQLQRLQAELAGSKSLSDNKTDADSQLQAQLSTVRQGNYRAQLTQLEEKIASLRASMDTNRLDQQILSARLKPLLEIEAMLGKLVASQYGARVNLLEAQEKRLGVERELQQAKNHEQELKRDLAALEAEKAAFDKGWRQKTMEDLLETTRNRDAIHEQLQKADKRHKLVILESPSEAVVLEIAPLSQGSVVREAEQLFVLVPLGAELEAEVKIDSIDIGHIKVGDVARVKVDAFSSQKHGTLDATVRTISEDAFRREKSPLLEQGMDAYYMARLSLGDSHLKKMAPGARLLPGMTLSAEIVVGKRTVMSYLLWPLMKALDESIREP